MRPITFQLLADATLFKASCAVRNGITYRDAQRTFRIPSSTIADNVTQQKLIEARVAVKRHRRMPDFSAEEDKFICDLLSRFSDRLIPLRRSNLQNYLIQIIDTCGISSVSMSAHFFG